MAGQEAEKRGETTASAELAVRARTVLAGARHALLTLPGARVRGWAGLIDDGGEPVLLVAAGSPPTMAAARSRRCRIDVPGADGERLVLAGQLRTVPGDAQQVAQRIAGPGLTVMVPDEGRVDDLVALALSVDDVLLCLPTADEPGAPRRPGWARRPGRAAGGRGGEPRWPTMARGQRVDLAAYALAEPDLITAYAPDLIEHLNTAHAGQLRRLAAHGRPRSGQRPLADPTDPVAVAGVAVSALDRTGLTLWVVGPAGADELRVTFRNELTEPRSLGMEIRRLLAEDAHRPD
ncbi:MAG: DUF2470 domain-containing protein [Frankia sp.]|nr:DUF2470 domain-containing protein [Frankia sp.]